MTSSAMEPPCMQSMKLPFPEIHSGQVTIAICMKQIVSFCKKKQQEYKLTKASSMKVVSL